ncbi:response regulator transcription factor [Cupriavidus agavae]|nr:response regulator [Cupriavidus agavae]
MGRILISRVNTPQVTLVSVIDDDESVRSSLVLLLRSQGFDSRGYASGEAFLEATDAMESRCLVVDVGLKGMSGIELQARLRSLKSTVPIIFISAHRDDETIRRAHAGGGRDFLVKPFSEATLLASIDRLLNP